MIKKMKFGFIILVLTVALVNSINILGSSLKESKDNDLQIQTNPANFLQKMSEQDNLIEIHEESPPSEQILDYTNDTTSYVTLFHPEEMVIWLFEDIPFNSTKYHIEITEYINPDFIDVDLFVKFGSIPTISDYDYKSSSPTAVTENIDIEAPNDHEYGDMYIVAYCVMGSGSLVMKSWYISDTNGCWRSADLISTPKNGETPISWSGNVTLIDTNDFYKVFLYSGQTIKIDAEVTTGSGVDYVDLYLYNENHSLFAVDTTGTELDIKLNLTTYTNQFYYLVFRYAEVVTGIHFYSVEISDENIDLDNRYDGASVSMITESGMYYGSMNNSDFNDYWTFYADSGEKFSIEIFLSEPLESPYFDAFIFASSDLIVNNTYDLAAKSGINLNLYYCCGEYNSSEIESGERNLIFLRIWNAARDAEVTNDSTDYSISFTREKWIEKDDLLSTSNDFTSKITNDTILKYDNVSDYFDINDYYKITTKIGYNIKIFVLMNSTSQAFLWGMLYDAAGNLLMRDNNGNITISYLAPYNGDYYFRVYEIGESNRNLSHESRDYYYFIYTSQIDLNNNEIINAVKIISPIKINGDVNSYDIIDFYQFYIPSGFKLVITYEFFLPLTLIIYNETLHTLPNNSTIPMCFIFQNRAIDTKAYFLLINNTQEYTLASYILNVKINQIDSDGSLLSALHIPITLEETYNRSDTLSTFDINDYYYFFIGSEERILVKIIGVNGMVVQLIQNVSSIETSLVSITLITNETVEFAYNGSQSQTFDFKFFLRVCNPGGYFLGNYTLEISRIALNVKNPIDLWIWLTIGFSCIIIVAVIVIATVYWKKRKITTDINN